MKATVAQHCGYRELHGLLGGYGSINPKREHVCLIFVGEEHDFTALDGRLASFVLVMGFPVLFCCT